MGKIRVVMLGTSGSAPAKGRGLPSVAVIYNGDVFLFDCGEGTQMQMLKFGINVSRVKAIFITHAHGDHIIGIAGIVRTLTLNGRREQLDVYVPSGQEGIIKMLLSFDNAAISYPISIKGINGGVVCKGKGFSVKAFGLRHSIKAYGYIFREDDRLRFVKEKANKAGLRGEMFSEITEKGRIAVKGKVINLKDVTWLQKGKSIAYVTDTRATRRIVPAIKGADLLIHESMYLSRDRVLAVSRSHSTAAEAAEIASIAKVKMLMLFHISPRYRNAKLLLNEAKGIFENTVVGKDGYNIYI